MLSLTTIASNYNDPHAEIKTVPFAGVGTHIPAEAKHTKRSRSLAFPSPKDRTHKRSKKDLPVGMSKEAVRKRRILEQIDDGTWILDPNKWAAYKSRLAKLDCNFEVLDDPQFVRHMKHSICGSWFVMSLPYNVGRFEKHTKSCTYSTASGGMKTLESYGVLVCPMNVQSPSPSIPPTSSSRASSDTNLPCLGITEKDDARIAQYFKHTPVTSAGGDDIHGIAQELFGIDFKNLSQDEKDIVRQKQLQTHSWSNDPIRKSIHAIGNNLCNGKARMGRDGNLMPCNQCIALLTSHAFRKAISRKCSENGNRRYTPHVFQSPDVGRIYSLGLYELLDGVRAATILIQCLTHD